MLPPRTVRAVTVLMAGMLLLGAPHASEACSVCRCGDPAFAALGLDFYNPGRFYLAIDWDRFEKEQGAADEQESLVEDRFTVSAAYAVTDRLTPIGRIPWTLGP